MSALPIIVKQNSPSVGLFTLQKGTWAGLTNFIWEMSSMVICEFAFLPRAHVTLLIFSIPRGSYYWNWVNRVASPCHLGQHSQIQVKSWELLIPSKYGDIFVAPGKTWRYGNNSRDWTSLSQASLPRLLCVWEREEGATTLREWANQKKWFCLR